MYKLCWKKTKRERRIKMSREYTVNDYLEDKVKKEDEIIEM